MTRRELPHVLPHRLRTRHVLVCQVVPYGLQIQTTWNKSRRNECLYFRRKQQIRAVPIVIERLDTQSVSDEKELPFALVPGGDGKHTIPIVNCFSTLQRQAL